MRKWYNVCLYIYNKEGVLNRRLVLARINGWDWAGRFMDMIKPQYAGCEGFVLVVE